MHFEAKKVNKSVFDYIKEGGFHLLKNPLIYIVTLGICTAVTFAVSYLPSNLRNVIHLIFGTFVMIWVMEITFSSTKEKYTVKKYITSLMLSFIGLKLFFTEIIFKTSAKYVFLLFVLICFIPDGIKEEQALFLHLSYLSNINIFTNIVIYSIWSKFIVTDPLIMARMTGDLDMSKLLHTAKDATKSNREIILKTILVSILLTFMTIIPFSNIIQFIVAISLTLFS